MENGNLMDQSIECSGAKQNFSLETQVTKIGSNLFLCLAAGAIWFRTTLSGYCAVNDKILICLHPVFPLE